MYYLWFSPKYLPKIFEYQETGGKMLRETDLLQGKRKPYFEHAHFGGLEKEENSFDQVIQV